MLCRNLSAWLVVAVAAATLSCGGGGPSSPSGTGVKVQGVVLGGASAVVAFSGVQPATAKAQKVTVTVAGTTITAEVAADGTFVLQGVPSGSFTLVFTVNGVEIGRVQIEAPDGSRVKVTVEVESSQLVVVTIKIEPRDGSETTAACLVNGGRKGQGIELEGSATSGSSDLFNMTVNGGRAGGLATVNAASASFRCVGGAKKSTVDECKALIAKGGAKVHVSGTLTECTPTLAEVAASEVKIQKD